jgi:hypothetical protein
MKEYTEKRVVRESPNNEKDEKSLRNKKRKAGRLDSLKNSK